MCYLRHVYGFLRVCLDGLLALKLADLGPFPGRSEQNVTVALGRQTLVVQVLSRVPGRTEIFYVRYMLQLSTPANLL